MATKEEPWDAWWTPASHQDAIRIWVDGTSLAASSSGSSSGPSGVGAVYADDRDDVHAERSESLGESTSGAAELSAVLCGLRLVPDHQRAGRVVVLFSSSQYVVGMLARGWRARANLELVARAREVAEGIGDLRVVWISSPDPGPSAERARQLARVAARGEASPATPGRGDDEGRDADPRPGEVAVPPAPEAEVGEQLALWPDPDPVDQVLSARKEWTPEGDEAERRSSVCSEDRTTADYVDGWNDALDVHALPLARRLRILLSLARRLQEGLVEATGYVAQVERGIRAMGYRIATNERLEPLRELAHALLRLEPGGESREPGEPSHDAAPGAAP